MPRPRRADRHLPANMYFKHGRHWYVKAGVWTPLPIDLGPALKEYADIVQAPRGGCAKLIADAFAEMKARTGERELAANTLKQYGDAARRLTKILEQFAPDQVKPKHAAAIKRSMSTKPNMANRIISFGRAVFDYGLEEQLVEVNPFLGIKRYKEKKRTRLIAWEEWWKIRAVAPRRLQLVMDGLYLTDQRIEDVLAIDERDGLDQGVYFEQGKTGKELIVGWNDDLRRWWDECRAVHGKVVRVAFEDKTRPRPLFRTRYGRRPAYKTVYDQWVLACERAKVEDCNLHDNRAFSATEMSRQLGGGERGEQAAQKLLGHDDRRTTKIYLRGREVEVVEGPSFRRLIDAAG
jgi:integrase